MVVWKRSTYNTILNTSMNIYFVSFNSLYEHYPLNLQKTGQNNKILLLIFTETIFKQMEFKNKTKNVKATSNINNDN